MRLRSNFFVTTWETCGRELRLFTRYAGDLIGGLASAALMLFIFFAMSPLFDAEQLAATTGIDNYFTYVAVAMVMLMFLNIVLGPANTVEQDLTNGTLEYVFFLPISRLGYFVGSALAQGIFSTILAACMFVVLAISPVALSLDWNNLPAVIAAFLLSAISLISFGVLLALITVIFKRAKQMLAFVIVLFQFFSGAYFPVQILPEPVQYISYLIPFTWVFELMRAYLVGAYTLLPVNLEWLVLAGFTAAYLAACVVAVRAVENRLRETGLQLL